MFRTCLSTPLHHHLCHSGPAQPSAAKSGQILIRNAGGSQQQVREWTGGRVDTQGPGLASFWSRGVSLERWHKASSTRHPCTHLICDRDISNLLLFKCESSQSLSVPFFLCHKSHLTNPARRSFASFLSPHWSSASLILSGSSSRKVLQKNSLNLLPAPPFFFWVLLYTDSHSSSEFLTFSLPPPCTRNQGPTLASSIHPIT